MCSTLYNCKKSHVSYAYVTFSRFVHLVPDKCPKNSVVLDTDSTGSITLWRLKACFCKQSPILSSITFRKEKKSFRPKFQPGLSFQNKLFYMVNKGEKTFNIISSFYSNLIYKVYVFLQAISYWVSRKSYSS